MDAQLISLNWAEMHMKNLLPENILFYQIVLKVSKARNSKVFFKSHDHFFICATSVSTTFFRDVRFRNFGYEAHCKYEI